MTQEITTAAQKTPRVSPLYLPQIYWMILANHRHPGVTTDSSFRLEWEERYLATLALLGIQPWIQPNRTFWDSSIDLSQKQLNVQQTVQSSKHLVRLCVDTKEPTTSRIDQCITYYCEAIGLASFESTFSPTNFFLALNTASGDVAAILMLARYLSLPYSTLKYVKIPPAQILQKASQSLFDRKLFTSPPPGDLENQSVQAYALGVYTQALEPLFAETYPTKKDVLPADLTAAAIKHFDPNLADWRNSDPSFELQQEIAAAILRRIADSKSSDSIHLSIKKSLEQHFNTRQTGGGHMTPRNIIIMGPPGTGKSLVLEKIAARLADNNDVSPDDVESLTRHKHFSLSPDDLRVIHVQFHPSYGYEDFVEGIRPVENKASKGVLRFTVVPGPLRAIAEIARSYFENASGDADAYTIRFSCFVKWSQDLETQIPTLQLEVASEFDIYRFPDRDGEILIKDGHKLLPIADTGGGKIVSKKIETTTGKRLEDLIEHESYTTLHWRPILAKIPNMVSFVLKIDELNRGNPAKIFGELLSLIEPSKRLGSHSPMQTTLPVSRSQFILPPNLHFLSAMNLADRSLAVLDQAFRRRFAFVYLQPDWSMIRDIEIYKTVSGLTNVNKDENCRIADFFENINKALAKTGVSEFRHIGHSYALQALECFYKNKSDSIIPFVTTIWATEIHSLLRDILEEDIDEFVNAYSKIVERDSPLGENDPIDTLKKASLKRAS